MKGIVGLVGPAAPLHVVPVAGPRVACYARPGAGAAASHVASKFAADLMSAMSTDFVTRAALHAPHHRAG